MGNYQEPSNVQIKNIYTYKLFKGDTIDSLNFIYSQGSLLAI
jgi:hypothetical protein